MVETFLAWGGAIVLAGNVGAVIFKVIKPSLDIRKRVEELERHDKRDYERLVELQQMNKAQLKILLVMIDHMIDGNNIEAMKKTRENIINLITDEQLSLK